MSMKGSNAMRVGVGPPQGISAKEKGKRKGGYSDVRAGMAINKHNMDGVAASTRQTTKGKSKPNIP